MQRGFFAAAVFTGAILVASLAFSQSASTGSIAGLVRDSTGAVLPGVTVEAASAALIEQARSAVTDEQGQYKILDLRPGTYTVTFSLAGFTTVKREGLELTTGFTATANADLRVGSIEETLTVTGASPVVDTQNVRTQNVLSRTTLDTLPTGKTATAWGSLTVGAVMVNGGQDVGGNRGESSGSLMIHGGRNTDQRVFLDGMSFNNAASQGGGYNYILFPNQMSTQEVTLETSGMSAESETAGIQINLVPKEGGNRFSGTFVGAYSGKRLQSDNLTDELRARGLTSTTFAKEIYDTGGGVGGPLKRNQLWFYAAARAWGAQEYAPGNYFNKTPDTLFYTPDFSRPAYQDAPNRDVNVRLTWQISKKNKLTIGQSIQHNCLCFYQVDTPRAPEASANPTREPLRLTQAAWTFPATGRVLLQGGLTYSVNGQKLVRSSGVTANDIPITELSTGYAYNAFTTYTDPAGPNGNSLYNQVNGRLVLSYVTGSHAFKSGYMFYSGTQANSTTTQGDAVSYAFRKPAPDALPLPVSVTYYANPNYAESRAMTFAFYSQDQWTLKRLTLNLGARLDSLHGWNPAQSKPAGIWVPGLSVPEIDNVPNWKDISPRLGAAYDLRGTGKTVLKASIGRYVQGELLSIASATNPQNAIVTTATRTWNDLNGDYVPQDSELGPLSNSAFGSVVINTRYSDDVLKGWWVRPYNWTGSVSFQQELRPGVGLTANYFRRTYGNFQVTDNLNVTPADYDPYCVSAPLDPRLPGGGGNQLCGFYDIKPSKFGQVDNLVTLASHFGNQSEVYNGVDVSVNARFARGAMLGGGVSTGQTVTDNCFTVDSPQQQRPGWCHVTYPFSGQTQLKLSGVYPLPWDLQASAVFQNLAGVPVTGIPIGAGQVFGTPVEGGTFVASNGAIAPSLGRNLGACGANPVCNATATVSLVPTYSSFENRLSQLDVRLTKTVRVRGMQVRGMLDAYNILNANTILNLNTRVGPTYLQPTRILGGRLMKFGAQLDF